MKIILKTIYGHKKSSFFLVKKDSKGNLIFELLSTENPLDLKEGTILKEVVTYYLFGMPFKFFHIGEITYRGIKWSHLYSSSNKQIFNLELKKIVDRQA